MRELINNIQYALELAGGLYIVITVVCLIGHQQESKRQGKAFMERWHNEPKNRDEIEKEERVQYGDLSKKTVLAIYTGGFYCLAMFGLGTVLALLYWLKIL